MCGWYVCVCGGGDGATHPTSVHIVQQRAKRAMACGDMTSARCAKALSSPQAHTQGLVRDCLNITIQSPPTYAHTPPGRGGITVKATTYTAAAASRGAGTGTGMDQPPASAFAAAHFLSSALTIAVPSGDAMLNGDGG